MKRAIRRLGVGALRVAVALVRRMSIGRALALGRGLGRLAGRLQKKRRAVAARNLDTAFGASMGPVERERIARSAFESFGMFAVEGMRFAFMSDAEIADLVEIDTSMLRTISDLLAEGRGLLLLTGHLGSFEVVARAITLHGYEVLALVRTARDRETTELMTSLRERNGLHVVPISGSLRPVIEGLRRGACVAIVCDQNAGDVFVPFFGRSTGTVAGPARIARRYGAPALVGFGVRVPGGRYRGVLGDVVRSNPSLPEDEDIRQFMTRVNELLEQGIRANPEQWLWFHDRWRSSPPAEGAE